MPLSEFLRMASQKNESGQQEPFSADPTSRSDSDIVELLWEDGQIMMQGQSSRATKTPLNTFPSNTNKPRTRKLSAADSVPHDVSRTTVPSQDMDLSQDNDMDSWFDSLTHDYGSVFLPEIPGVAPNTDGMLAQNSFSLVDKRGNFGQDGSNLQQSGLGSSKASGSKDRQLSSWPPPLPHHHQTSSALGSGVSGIVNNMGSHSRPDVFLGNPAQSRDTRPPTNNSANYLNFSHFARSASLVKANASNSVKEKSSGGKGIIPTVVKSTLVEGFNSVSSGKSVVTKAIKDSISCPSENLCQETTPVANDDPSTQSNAIESAKGVPCKERIVEHVVASSSVGSGNSADRVSCEQTHNSKRKYRDAEDSEDRSEDVGVEKTTLAGGNGGSKRSRAAEVHNLSERRRRDRINEKMRALQELIPNSNKADKASMLDEAIEYLKTLQHQVQVMSLGAGLCMPQMMFPQGMQHMHPARIPHFSQMGPAGMGIGFGMGMLDINGGFPVFPVSSLHPPHFSTSLPTNFHRIPSPNLPVYGHPIQGLPLTGQPSHVNSAIGLSGLRNGSRNTVLGTSPVLNSGVSPLLNCYTEANQPHATEDVLNQSATARENEDAARASSLLTMTLPATDVSKEPFEQ